MALSEAYSKGAEPVPKFSKYIKKFILPHHLHPIVSLLKYALIVTIRAR
jgi:hypothetical protein